MIPPSPKNLHTITNESTHSAFLTMLPDTYNALVPIAPSLSHFSWYASYLISALANGLKLEQVTLHLVRIDKASFSAWLDHKTP